HGPEPRGCARRDGRDRRARRRRLRDHGHRRARRSLFTGLAVFTALALATIVVVAIAVIGSVTVLPAVLALLGDRVDKGRLRFLGRPRPRAGHGAWGALARTVTRHPAAALVTAVCVIGTLAVPALDMHPANSGTAALPA